MDICDVEITPTLRLGKASGLFFIAGPCVIENEQMALDTAGTLAEIAALESLPLVFKSSFDKANRSSISSFRGPGLEDGLATLSEVRRTTSLPLLSDVHETSQVEAAAAVLDILQIPAFLCRQTDLLVAAARTGKVVNVKKGQFLAPWDMKNTVEKIRTTGNRRIMLTERGSTFGYNNLVSDMRSVPLLRALGFPVVYDATHSVQLPGGRGHESGGQREMITPLARAAVAAGADGIFVEVHPDPGQALCDGANSLPLTEFRELALRLRDIYLLVRKQP